MARLDAALLALVDPLECGAEQIPHLLDQALAGSLWVRRLLRLDEGGRRLARAILVARAGAIWSLTTPAQRRGYFSAGLGFEAGLHLDENAPVLNRLLGGADESASQGDPSALVDALIGFAEIVFRQAPFRPGELPVQWQQVLRLWLSGETAGSVLRLAGEAGVRFLEDGLAYRLVWALEAVRVRAVAHGSPEASRFTGRAAIAVETGISQLPAALMIQAGLPSRVAARVAAEDGEATFSDLSGMRTWLTSTKVDTLSRRPDWPTPETCSVWQTFRASARRGTHAEAWSERDAIFEVVWRKGARASIDDPMFLQLVHEPRKGRTAVCEADLRRLGHLATPLPAEPTGIFVVRGLTPGGLLRVKYIGPDDQSIGLK